MAVEDELFQLPLSEFTAARNALAADLKARGHTDEAARVKGLTRPPASAWAVNQLFWRHRKPFEELLAAGERLNKAQASQLRGRGGDLHEPMEARRSAVANLSRHAATLLEQAGHSPTPDLMRRITTTLEALATYGGQAGAPPAGRLTADVNAPGFEAVAALVSGNDGAGRQPPRVLPFARATKPAREKLDPAERKRRDEQERRARGAAAAEKLRSGERDLAQARQKAAQAEALLKKAAARAKDAKRKQDALAASLEKATAVAERARQDAHRVASEAEDAAQAVTDAERAVEQARAEVRTHSKS